MRDTLVKKLESQINESDTGLYEVGEQRERNHRFYSLQPMGNEQKGRSHYIDPTVLDVVESRKALFDETFLSNRQTVKFKSGAGHTPFESDAKTAYAMDTLRKNKHERLFRDGWHDAFVAKRQVVCVSWKKDTREVELDLQPVSEQQLQQIIAMQKDAVNVDESQLVREQGMVSGTLIVEEDDSYAQIELIQPELYYRDPQATYPDEAQWNTIEDDQARGELIKDGYEEDQVMKLTTDYRFRSDEEDYARKAHDGSASRRGQTAHNRTSTQETVTRYRTWTWCDLTDDDEYKSDDHNLNFTPREGIRLYEIHWSHGEVLRWADGTAAIKEADDCCFFEWSEMKISHAENGLCSADLAAHNQKTASVLKRLVIDNQQMRNNTRYEAAIGALKNPRDLLDGTIGGVIWSRAVGSVAPLATPELSPLTFNVLEMIGNDTERRDGYSSLGKGTNTDVLKYQNSENMVDRLTSAGTRRPMKAARDWAQTWLIPVCQRIVYLGIRNDKSTTQMEVKGRMIPVTPGEWKDDGLYMETAVALTPDEAKAHAGNLMQMHGTLKEDEEMSMLYGMEQKHALLDEVFDSLGITDTTPYMKRPDDPTVMQAMKARGEMQKEEKEKADEILKIEVGLKKSEDRRKWEEFNWDRTQDMDKSNREHDDQQHDQTQDKKDDVFRDEEFAHTIDKDDKEFELEKTQRRPVSVGN
jgi:hypothetical protein